MIDTRMMRTWAEIDLDALAHNYRELRALLPSGCRFLGLVKANAYGHGALRVAQKLQELGADMLAVACVAEAAELREGGITAPILCLGHTPPQLAPALLELDVVQTVEDLETGKTLSAAAQQAGKPIKIHVKLDTGMGRLGFLWQADGDNGAVLNQIEELCALPGLEAEGIFTHFSDADGDERYTRAQLDRFIEARAALEKRGVRFQVSHCGASAAVLHYPCTHMDMVRPGIALYGYYPASWLEGPDSPELRPVMTLKSRVCAVRSLPAGSCISYGRTAVLERDSRVAVVPIGYGDGYPRVLSNRMEMEVRGMRCPVLGRVCMDMCMLDVTDVPGAAEGDTAVAYGPGLTQQAAELADTIVYELLTSVSPRVPRIYVERDGEEG